MRSPDEQLVTIICKCIGSNFDEYGVSERALYNKT